MTEIVEVPDVVPTDSPDSPTVFLKSQPVNTKVPPTATPVEVSQAPPCVTNEGSSLEVLGPCLTATAMNMYVDASESHGSAPHSAPAFDLNAWLTNAGLVPNR